MPSANNNGRIVDLRKKKPGAPLLEQVPLPLQPQKRTSPVRARRRRARLITLSLVVAVLISGTLLVSYASYLPQYSVERVVVQGAQAVPPVAIADYADSIIYNGSHNFLSRANIFLYPRALIQEDIPLEFPRIQSASISSESLLANVITVTVVEHQPFALWCLSDAGICYDMDQSGFLFSQAPENATTSTPFVFSGGVSTSSASIGQTFAPGHTAGLIAFLQELGQSGLTPLGANVESDDQDFTVPLQQGFYIEASFGEDAGTLVNNLQLILSSSALLGQEQNLEYVDLRFGDRVYYKLKGQSEASTTAQ